MACFGLLLAQNARAEWELIHQWGGVGGVEDIAIDSGGLVYVLDRPNGRVVVFTADGEYVREQGGLDDPTGLAINENDVVYVQERCRIYRMTTLFQFLGGWESCLGQGDLQLNRGLDARDGIVWVATLNDVLKFEEDGTFIGRFMSGLGGTDVHAVPDGSVWVSIDYGSDGLVRHYSSGGQVLAEWSAILPDDESSAPFDISVDGQERIYVGDGRIKIFKANGELEDVLAPPLGYYFEAELDGDDILYVGRSIPSEIVKYHRVPVAVENVTWGWIKARMAEGIDH
jgi:sugar lactone lactonase YvrE